MEEKKLTDEEIIKELINESNRGEWCEISFINCVEVRVLKNAIDLIHRLQEHNGNEVRMRCDMQRKFDDLQNLCIEQKAEIERLTEVRNAFRQEVITLNNEKLELQKQVDILQESHYITYERAVKTTAQKILQDLFYFIDGNNFWLEETGNQVFLIKENDALNFMRKKASEYEVEVEE